MGSLLRRTVQEVLDRGLADPRIRGLISVGSVRVSEDFADATVMISVMPAVHATLTMHGLRAAAPRIRASVAKRADLRRTPRLHFRLDSVARREADVLAAIRQAMDETSEETTEAPSVDGAADIHAQDGESLEAPRRATWGRPWTDDEPSDDRVDGDDVEETRS